MTLDIVIGFFLLGAVAGLAKIRLPYPESLYQTLTLFLMLAIGLKGGKALAAHLDGALLIQSSAVVAFGALLPVVAYPVLRGIGELRRVDAASIAAHYGSVSVATYAVGVAALEARGIEYEAWFPLFVVLLEMPAIVVGILLAHGLSRSTLSGRVLREAFLSPGIVLMAGGLMIGLWAGDRVERVAPLFFDLFHGVLALFLLKMGLVCAEQTAELRRNGLFLAAFGVFMPLVGGVSGAVLGQVLGFSTGGIALLAVLGASASYIAVPAAMRVALPEANAGLSIAASLGVTFPFNVVAGIPLYILLGEWLG